MANVERWAIVNAENSVVNVVFWDPTCEWLPPRGHLVVACKNSACGIGDIYDISTGEFIKTNLAQPDKV